MNASKLKIKYPAQVPSGLTLGDLDRGDVFAFEERVTQHLNPTKVCMVAYMHQSYRSQEERYSDKIPVMNLSEGRVSLIGPSQPVRRITAELNAKDQR